MAGRPTRERKKPAYFTYGSEEELRSPSLLEQARRSPSISHDRGDDDGRQNVGESMNSPPVEESMLKDAYSTPPTPGTELIDDLEMKTADPRAWTADQLELYLSCNGVKEDSVRRGSSGRIGYTS